MHCYQTPKESMILYFQYRVQFRHCYHLYGLVRFEIHFFRENPISGVGFSKLIQLDLKELVYDCIIIESTYLVKLHELSFHQFLFTFPVISIYIFTLFFSFRSHTQLVAIFLFAIH